MSTQQEFDNQKAFNVGLIGLEQFLETKQRLVVEELDEERIAALKNLDARQRDLVAKAQKADTSNDPKDAAAYHEALKKVEEADKSLIEVESKLQMQRQKGSDENQKAMEDDAINKNAMAARWDETYRANYDNQLAMAAQFYAMQDAFRGFDLSEELLKLDQEQAAWIEKYAKDTESFEEYERRKLEITEFYNKKRTAAEQSVLQNTQAFWAASQKWKQTNEGNLYMNLLQITDSFYKMSKGKSKEALIAYQVMKSGETVITTASTAMKAYDSMASIPYVGPFLGAAAAAAAVAYGAEQLSSIWSIGSDGSGGTLSAGSASISSGSSGSLTQLSTPAPKEDTTPVAPIYNIHIYGDGKYSDWDRIVRNDVIPALNKAKYDGERY